MSLELEGKVALITGAGRGIGRTSEQQKWLGVAKAAGIVPK